MTEPTWEVAQHWRHAKDCPWETPEGTHCTCGLLQFLVPMAMPVPAELIADETPFDHPDLGISELKRATYNPPPSPQQHADPLYEEAGPSADSPRFPYPVIVGVLEGYFNRVHVAAGDPRFHDQVHLKEAALMLAYALAEEIIDALRQERKRERAAEVKRPDVLRSTI
jgi:hypothetical protein